MVHVIDFGPENETQTVRLMSQSQLFKKSKAVGTVFGRGGAKNFAQVNYI